MDELDRLEQAVLRTAKYKNICADVVRNIGSNELRKRRTWKAALKATKKMLHQVGAAYLDSTMPYDHWLAELRQAAGSGDSDRFRSVCLEVMGSHSSTRERLCILEQFYEQTLGGLPPIRSVLDIASGLNPLAVRWMPLAEGVRYHAYDMYTDMVAFLSQFFRLAGVEGEAVASDVTQCPPPPRADLALILKSLPCLEQLDKSVGPRLLETLDAHHLLVSFPVHSLGRREKGMLANYERRFRELTAGHHWSVRRFEFATELAFLVSK